jgi:4-hydroxymandelate oxidase
VVDLSSLEESARAILNPSTFAYIAGGVGDELTVRANVGAWAGIRLRPFMLRDVSAVSTATTVLGTPVPFPVLIAPTAMHGLVCADGELATARAAAAAGTIYVLSMAATTSLEDVAAAAPGAPRWMQLYIQRDRGLTRAVCARAREAGYQAVVVTVDSPVTTKRARIPRSGFNVPAGLALPNMAPAAEGTPDIHALVEAYDASLTFDDLGAIAEWAGLPLLVKGILRGDDARRCLDAGADGIVVSNHGGRQVDGCVPTAYALADVVDEVGGDREVLVDGGIRNGAGVLKALALGARAVLVGRPVVWGLAVDGQQGAVEVLAELRDELERVMGLCGLTDATRVPADLVAAERAGWPDPTGGTSA